MIGRSRLGSTVVLQLAAPALILLLASAASAETVYGVTQEGFLVNWDSATPGAINSGSAIQGLQAGESIVGLDFRPANGQLYAMGSFSRLYTINPGTGQAQLVGGGPINPFIDGSHFGTDFNPVADRFRFTSNADQNLRINVDTLAVTVDPELAFGVGDPNFGADPNVVGSAYINNFAGAASTILYSVDAGLDILVRHTIAPGFGTLNTVGSLGTDVTEMAGFDVSASTGIAYLVIRDSLSAQSTFWSVDPASGAATSLGTIGGGNIITAMSVALPAPGALALLGLVGLVGRGRRA